MYQQTNQQHKKTAQPAAMGVSSGAKSMPAVSVLQARNITGSQVIQRAKDVVKGEYTLTIDDDAFEVEALAIWDFIDKKKLTDTLLNKKIHIIKTPGKNDKVCHHWSFGGLNAGFSLNIDKIHEKLGGSETPLLFEDGEDSGFKAKDWNTITTPNGLSSEGDVADTNITMYDDTAHSSRKKGELWYHKFVDTSHIFAIEGYEGTLGYPSQKSITVGALAESGLGAASWFQYKKTPTE